MDLFNQKRLLLPSFKDLQPAAGVNERWKVRR